MRGESPKIFVAYASRDEEVAAVVFDAVRRANALPLPNLFEPWPYNDVSGRPIISPIIENIDEAPYVVADITYFNLNVVYEIGFAIGRKKRVMLMLDSGPITDIEVFLDRAPEGSKNEVIQ